MKKPTRKLVLRAQTVRILTTVNLEQVIAGLDSGQQSIDACPHAAVVVNNTVGARQCLAGNAALTSACS